MNYQIFVHCFLGLFRIGYQFADKILALLDHFQVEAVEIDVDELIHTNQRFFLDFVMILIETDQLAVLVQSQKQHLQAIVDSQSKPISNQTHQNLKENQVNTLLSNRAFKSHQLLQKNKKLLPFSLVSAS